MKDFDFGALLDQQLRNYRKGFNPGDTVKARVVTVGEAFVTLDVNAKSVGLLPIEDVQDSEGEVTVKRGDSASRIASEHGSTLASLERLNGGNVEKIRIGAKLHVMDHPRFNLVLRRRTRIADLSLNGKFFKRYDLQGEIKAREGAYEVPERRKLLWEGLGSVFGKGDRAELEMLLPKGAPVLVSEF